MFDYLSCDGIARAKQRQTYEDSSKRKLTNMCIELSFGSMLVAVWGLQGLLGMLMVVPCAPRVAWIHLGTILGVKSLPRKWILKVLDSIWAPFCMPFEGPLAPGHASGGYLCPRDGLDQFLDRF